jgi:hypothetical protein
LGALVVIVGSISPAKAVIGTLTNPAKLNPELTLLVSHAPAESGKEFAIVPPVVAPMK